MISLATFLLCYVLFVIAPHYKAWTALGGALILILTGQLSVSSAFFEVHWNVMGLFVGTLVLAELFMLSRVPAVIAEWLVDHSRSVRSALIKIFILSSVISMFVENVAVVLLVAPVALSLTEKLKISPIKPLILIAMFSNLQGASTLIGDPPSMILGSYLKMSFNDFFFFEEKPSIFFIIQAGFVSTLIYAFWLFRKSLQSIELVKVENVRSLVPSALLLILISLLVFSSQLDPDSIYLAGTAAMTLGVIGLVWNHYGPKWGSSLTIIRTLDWDTSLFLLALFILVGAIRLNGWMDSLAAFVIREVPENLILLYLFIIIFSVIISAFVDNVPYILAMIPVVEKIAAASGYPVHLLAFALLVGACLGGNITPIGASANIACVSLLKKEGHHISFLSYVKIGIIYTAWATIPAAIVLWIIWA
ncbi:SLC13 family permease [Estrella lausannensis]|uniref:Putative arsenite permease n=1 Tax=Estrella lausannensis TaxID=483423 RepID=A0A0H5DUB7_9BACT|nr:SLC13 family permease [Estrella lausannensis]CRX39524.1 Putative arsenite permease [Estrella lausannensis]